MSSILPHCKDKYGICVSASNGKYFLINSEHRKMYDDFEIDTSEYSFLTKERSFIGCSEAHILDDELIIEKLGNINYGDMQKILGKVRNSKYLIEAERIAIASEIEVWLGNYQENQLKNIFHNR